MIKDTILWLVCFGTGILSVIYLEPGTFWQRVMTVPVCLAAFFAPFGIYVAYLYFKPNEKDE